MPKMIGVSSSSVEAVGYEPTAAELWVQFNGGRIYIYDEVPQHVFDALLYAPSKGTYINQQVKPVYHFRNP